MKDFLMNETIKKVDSKIKDLETQIEQLKYVNVMIKDMQFYCKKRDEDYNFVKDENDNYIFEYPTDPFAIGEYEKRKNVIDIVDKAIL